MYSRAASSSATAPRTLKHQVSKPIFHILLIILKKSRKYSVFILSYSIQNWRSYKIKNPRFHRGFQFLIISFLTTTNFFTSENSPASSLQVCAWRNVLHQTEPHIDLLWWAHLQVSLLPAKDIVNNQFSINILGNIELDICYRVKRIRIVLE
jgi:hypothetical protein